MILGAAREGGSVDPMPASCLQVWYCPQRIRTGTRQARGEMLKWFLEIRVSVGVSFLSSTRSGVCVCVCMCHTHVIYVFVFVCIYARERATVSGEGCQKTLSGGE